MAKITDLPVLAPDDVDGQETLPVVKGEDMVRLRARPLVDALAQPHVQQAQAWAEGIEPDGPGSKSARIYAEEMAASSARLDLLSTDVGSSVAFTDALGFESSRLSHVWLTAGAFDTPLLGYAGDGRKMNFVDSLGFEHISLSGSDIDQSHLTQSVLDHVELSAERFDTPLLGYIGGGSRLNFVDGLGFELPGATVGVPAAAATPTIAERDEANKAASSYIRAQIVPAPPMTCDYAIAVSEGQSFSIGSQAGAALTTTSGLSCLMLGDQVRAASIDDVHYTPIGPAMLKPLSEGRQGPGSGGSTVVPAGEGTAYYGETYMSGWLRTLKARMAAMVFQPDIPSRKLVAVAAGVGGRSIAQLSKGAAPEIYLRGNDAVRQIAAIAAAQGETAIVSSLSWSQGENDAGAARAAYKAALISWISNKRADYMALTGQAVAPLVYLTPPGGSYTRDDNLLGVQMAFLDVADEVPGVYLVGPYYQYPDPGAHLLANSYRWHGCQIGKVAFITQVLGRAWHPLRPRKATVRETTLLVDFLVPSAPLRFGTPYNGAAEVNTTDKGFRVTDGGGEVPLTAVEIVADTVVRITLSRVISGTARLWYGDKTYHAGMGQLCDSDPWTHDFVWTYPAPDLSAGENISALNNQPYCGANWCVQFCLDVVKEA
ncbi:hypothetical protein [Novosphingobium pituita]|uniref:Sialate O-acetylesterase domain-containing protein n=1 Tax=Novosphingobium pituita TaxID=3056842 RepID=A0ABQ6P4A1_9SPHN|nr:hypothetical protein [Novosphingobium sp. IK01]GMM59910.1 hypothetical protein NUTIK01_06870 [Novosphingobium sp. IK01]